MYIIRPITTKTSFLLHKNLPGLILGGYTYGPGFVIDFWAAKNSTHRTGKGLQSIGRH